MTTSVSEPSETSAIPRRTPSIASQRDVAERGAGECEKFPEMIRG